MPSGTKKYEHGPKGRQVIMPYNCPVGEYGNTVSQAVESPRLLRAEMPAQAPFVFAIDLERRMLHDKISTVKSRLPKHPCSQAKATQSSQATKVADETYGTWVLYRTPRAILGPAISVGDSGSDARSEAKQASAYHHTTPRITRQAGSFWETGCAWTSNVRSG
ncbi:hypothetical protein AC579_6046 [Pseudocercospora musae]|uniref:Uncharacterized protein n=1 Tax=Pseudocercospora musae TaxID=113226 RepID=A0A139IF23_9PEZI|nr:hypothetical protein AC579_6046 [Pseudocercospora musae]